MKAMILAAGRGERLRPLTDRSPKPLLAVGGKPLLAWHLQALAQAGLREVLINHAHLGQMLIDFFGDGAAYGLHITWSAEPPGALETAGGIRQALPALGDAAFLVVNGDIHCDWDFAAAEALAARLNHSGDLAHLVMVDNPPQHPEGDFVLADGRLRATAGPETARLTFSGIGVYAPALFAGLEVGVAAKLAPLLVAAMSAGRVSGELHCGAWHDIGTAERLAALDAQLRADYNRP